MASKSETAYMKTLFRLEELLSEHGETPLSIVIEEQMKYSFQRTEDRIDKALSDGQRELSGLRLLLITEEIE